jgi:hypothetical protein|tara:strand:- start:4998 stop:5195 length:198 start_codon:yes stop_codon:yes gene_type:complete
MRFSEVGDSRFDANDDEYNKWEVDDTRRPRLTLRHLNKMRNMREMKQAEHKQETATFRQMYSRSE